MIEDYSKDFGPFDGKVWLNCASEGAMPHVAAQAAQEAIGWKIKPFNLTHQRFREVPLQLKTTIGRLMNVDADDVILGNSATYGIHLLAHGLPVKTGDEIIVMQNDFPTDILPWLWLEKKGVNIRQLKPRGHILTAEEIEANITPQTKVVCLPHVHTFSGHIVDILAIGRLCRQRRIIFVVNFSQSLGTRPIDLAQLPVDAMTTAGFKWLLGPYGTGFCWMQPKLREQLQYHQAFWVNTLSQEEREREGPLSWQPSSETRRLDVFGTANFFNFRPLTVSIQYLLNIGLGKVHQHNDTLVEQLLSGLEKSGYDLISPRAKEKRSTLVVFSHPNKERNKGIHQELLAQGICLALWKGHLRASAHIYNTAVDIEKLISTLKKIG